MNSAAKSKHQVLLWTTRIGRFKNNLFTVIFNGFKKKVKLDDQFLDKKSMKLELLLSDY
jgi:hypothetical protein